MALSLGGHIAPISLLAIEQVPIKEPKDLKTQHRLERIDEKLECPEYKKDFLDIFIKLEKNIPPNMAEKLSKKSKLPDKFINLFNPSPVKSTNLEDSSTLKKWFFETLYTYDALWFFKTYNSFFPGNNSDTHRGCKKKYNDTLIKKLESCNNSKILNIFIVLNKSKFFFKDLVLHEKDVKQFKEMLDESRSEIIENAIKPGEDAVHAEKKLESLEFLIDNPIYQTTSQQKTSKNNILCTVLYTQDVINAIEATPVLNDILRYKRSHKNKMEKNKGQLKPHFEKILEFINQEKNNREKEMPKEDKRKRDEKIDEKIDEKTKERERIVGIKGSIGPPLEGDATLQENADFEKRLYDEYEIEKKSGSNDSKPPLRPVNKRPFPIKKRIRDKKEFKSFKRFDFIEYNYTNFDEFYKSTTKNLKKDLQKIMLQSK